MDYEGFLSYPKSKVISPAGYGKTYSLSECIKYVKGKALILTHTHAGISSIKAKLKSQLVDPKYFHVETISSFAQKYTNAYYLGTDTPEQEDSNEYHSFTLSQSKAICSTNVVQDVLFKTYERIFIDEYQDCTQEQHELIQTISEKIPTHIFGDPLQGIFGFGGQVLVDFDNDLHDFHEAPALSTPYRWNNAGSNGLGQDLHNIRDALEQGEDVDLRNYAQIQVVQAPERDIYRHRSNYQTTIYSLLSEDSLLVIHPISERNAPRIKFAKQFKGISPIESIDDKDFYRVSKLCDNVNLTDKVLAIRNLAYELFDKSGLDNWFNDTGLKRKRDDADKAISENLANVTNSVTSLYDLDRTLEHINKITGVNCTRKEIYKSILSALSLARADRSTVYEAMKKQRNIIRRQGRRVHGRHIGTTLLTKGLEFDTVLILDAHKFNCPKHLYVALTRCCNRLIVITENPVLSPYT